MRRTAAAAIGVALAATAALAVWARRPAPPRPNVLILLWDTARADRMSFLGADRPTTPRMGAWAETHGTVFEHAVASDMWTVPTHASLFTGLPSTGHGAGIDHRWLDGRHVTLAELLAREGFDTYAFSANPNLARDRVNLLQGFTWVDQSWDPRWARMAANQTRRKLMAVDRSTEISPGHPERDASALVFNAATVAHRAFTTWLDTDHASDRPFFAYLSYMEAHKPRVPSLAARRRVADDATIAVGLETDVTLQRQLLYSYGKAEYTDRELDAIRAVYDAALADLDDATADLLADLDARGILDDTLVIWTADHGEQLGEHHQLGHRSGLSQALVHVPLVVSWPGHLPVGRVSTPVSTAGLFATVLEQLALAAPDTAFVRDDWFARTLPQSVFSETLGFDRASFERVRRLHPDLAEDRYARTLRSVREGRWRWVESLPRTGAGPAGALYDLDADPAERHDLASDAPEVARRLAAEVRGWQEGLPRWDPSGADAPAAPDEDERRQLEALGYLEGAGASAGGDGSSEKPASQAVPR